MSQETCPERQCAPAAPDTRAALVNMVEAAKVARQAMGVEARS